MQRSLKIGGLVMGGLCFCLISLLGVCVLVLSLMVSIDVADFNLRDNTCYVDRMSKMLLFLPDQKGERHVWVAGDKIPEQVKQAFIAAEDSRFFKHNGYDCYAITRAFLDNWRNGKIVSGASTITQQLVRLVYPRERTYWGKVVEVMKSSKLEKKLTKDQILEQYLNRVPMGNTIVGIGLASKVFFGKPLHHLNLAEAAILAALPKAPGYYNPYRSHRQELIQRKNWVLSRMHQLDFISRQEYEDARNIVLRFLPKHYPDEALHLVHTLRKRYPQLSGQIRTTIDLNLQHKIENILRSHQQRLSYRGAQQAACLIVHNPTGAVLSSIGSMRYGPVQLGYNDGTQALRSPGSTLKPFLYALALQQGYTPAELLEDTTRRYAAPKGEFIPSNYDRRTYGPVSMRKALGNSLNLAALNLLNKIGYSTFFDCLKRLGLINFPDLGPDYYGLGLVVGNPEVTLEQLVAAYSMFARGGIFQPLHYLEKPTLQGEQPKVVFSAAVAAIINDMLADPGARTLAFGSAHCFNFPFRIALKTGTGPHYRDCWTIGYTPEYTVGVWVGNFEGSPTYNLSGATGAGPIFADIIELLYHGTNPGQFSVPPSVVKAEVCGISGMKPGPYCQHVSQELFVRGSEPQKPCTFHVHDAHYHRLPYPYAQWLYRRDTQDMLGSYRLTAGPGKEDTEFDDPWKKIDSGNTSVMLTVSDPVTQEQGTKMSPAPQQKNRCVTIEKAPLERIPRPPEHGPASLLDIVYPLPGDRFILERSEPDQAILLQARSTEPLAQVTWFVDGMEYATTGHPFQIYWKLTQGSHQIIATSPEGTGDRVTIWVE